MASLKRGLPQTMIVFICYDSKDYLHHNFTRKKKPLKLRKIPYKEKDSPPPYVDKASLYGNKNK